MPAPSEVTRLLTAASDGDAAALDAVLPLLYTELHELAHRQRRRQRGPATLNTTALLHEAYEKLANAGSAYVDRSHFFRISAQAMRQILVDYARSRLTAKRGAGEHPATYDDSALMLDAQSEETLALDEALGRLATLSTRQATLVELRYFGGFTLPEVADLLGISPSTASRDWTAARAWLQRELGDARFDTGAGTRA
ncbi:MAG: ECF-type sigma factor [Bacteroidota bacterium]